MWEPSTSASVIRMILRYRRRVMSVSSPMPIPIAMISARMCSF